MSSNIEQTYSEIADYINSKDGQCALILGPELAVNKQGISFKNYFNKIADDKSNGIFRYFEKDNLFSFNDEVALKNTRRRVKEFYNNCGDNTLLEMIAQIKFPLIINVCPDLALNKMYDEKNIGYNNIYFSKDSKPKFKDVPLPSKECPVILNIFGSIDADTSLILNYSKLYETIQYLLPDNSLPENIETYLDQTSGFILLGLKFDSWYYQLLCHKLKLKEYNKSKTNLSTSDNELDDDSVSLVMRENFEIDFTPDNPMQALKKIINRCNKNSLRDLKTSGSQSLYVSYSWKDDNERENVNRETVVDWLQKYSPLKDVNALLFFRDRNNLKYGDSIDSFMTRIGKGKIVIRVISDKYLKSKYCMTEAIRIAKYNDDEKRVVTILWEDADLENETNYLDYWKEKCQDILKNDIKLYNNDYDFAVGIYRFFLNGFIERLKSEVDSGDLINEQHGFIYTLKDVVNMRISKNDFTIDQESSEIRIAESKKEQFDGFVNNIISKIKGE